MRPALWITRRTALSTDFCGGSGRAGHTGRVAGGRGRELAACLGGPGGMSPLWAAASAAWRGATALGEERPRLARGCRQVGGLLHLVCDVQLHHIQASRLQLPEGGQVASGRKHAVRPLTARALGVHPLRQRAAQPAGAAGYLQAGCRGRRGAQAGEEDARMEAPCLETASTQSLQECMP